MNEKLRKGKKRFECSNHGVIELQLSYLRSLEVVNMNIVTTDLYNKIYIIFNVIIQLN
jgi:hypothetical protein